MFTKNGSFSNSICTGECKVDEEPLTVAVEEEFDKSSDEEDENGEEVGDGDSNFEEHTPEDNQKPLDVRFEAYVIQDQRILDNDDDVIRFDDRSMQGEHAVTDNLNMTQTAQGVGGDQQGGGWKFQNSNRVKQKIRQIVRKELRSQDSMSEEEASQVPCRNIKTRLSQWISNKCLIVN